MKEKIELEYGLNSTPTLLYPRLSSPSGLSEWFAEDANINGDIITFQWDGQKQRATVVGQKKNEHIRFKWEEDDDEESYFEFAIRKDELTGDTALVVTDFAEAHEKEEAIELWNFQVAELKHILGS
ncbi:MAG: START-like domain-containing protein [Bacteroidales bacterium]